MAIKGGQQILAKEVLGLSGIPNGISRLSLTTNYQDFVAAPTTRTRKVNKISLVNYDSTVKANFFIKMVRSAIDYIPIQIALAPTERLDLYFPFLLNSVTKLQAKVDIAVSNYAWAGYSDWYGDGMVANITGTGYTTLSPSSDAMIPLGLVMTNTHTAAQNLLYKVLDGSSNILDFRWKSVQKGASWFIDLRQWLSVGGASVQVAAGTAAAPASVYFSYIGG